MGFRLDRGYHLTFEGSALEGAEVHFKSTPIGVVLEMLSDDITSQRQIELLCKYVTEWNFEDPDGATLPITVDAIKAGMEEAVLAKVLLEWFRAARGITAPLDPPSNDGKSFPVESLPMEAL